MWIAEHPVWTWITIGAVVLGFIAAVWFIIRYWIEAGRDAWRNPFGRYLLQRKIVLASLFGLVLINQIVGQWPGRRIALAVVMVAFALQTFVPYRLLMDAQRAHTKEARRMSEPRTNGEGAGELTRDSLLGNTVNGVVTVAGLGIVEALGSIDFSTLPTFLATMAAPLAGYAAGLITSKFLPRYRVRR